MRPHEQRLTLAMRSGPWFAGIAATAAPNALLVCHRCEAVPFMGSNCKNSFIQLETETERTKRTVVASIVASQMKTAPVHRDGKSYTNTTILPITNVCELYLAEILRFLPTACAVVAESV